MLYAGDETKNSNVWMYVTVRAEFGQWASLVKEHQRILGSRSASVRHELKWRSDRDYRLPMLEALVAAEAEVLGWRFDIRPGGNPGLLERARKHALIALLRTAGAAGGHSLVLLDERQEKQDEREKKILASSLRHWRWPGCAPAWTFLESMRVPALQFADMAAGALGALALDSEHPTARAIEPAIRLIQPVSAG